MEYSKLGLEHFTPEYTRYFHGLDEARRDDLRAGQDLLYKGISADTSAAIYDRLYEATVGGAKPDVAYTSSCAVTGLEPVTTAADRAGWRLRLHHLDQDTSFEHESRVVIFATGYHPAPLPVDATVSEMIERDSNGRPAIDLDYRVRLHGQPKSTLFAQNAELHTHGVGAPDLGLGAHRNAVLANTLSGREVYPVRSDNVFQSFGAPT
jgi:lysine N6-hydroxylase